MNKMPFLMQQKWGFWFHIGKKNLNKALSYSFQEPVKIFGGKATCNGNLSLRHLSIKLKYPIFIVHCEFAFHTTSVCVGWSYFLVTY